MLKITVETDSGVEIEEPAKIELDGEPEQFKVLWEKAEAAHLDCDPLGFAAGMIDCTMGGMPSIKCKTLGRDGWIAYAVMRQISDQHHRSIPETFELVARETIDVTIRRGAADEQPLAMDIISYSEMEEQP